MVTVTGGAIEDNRIEEVMVRVRDDRIEEATQYRYLCPILILHIQLDMNVMISMLLI